MIEIIKQQLILTYDGDPWYGSSVKSVMNSVKTKFVFESPGNGMHSIAGIMAHMLTWRNFAEKRLMSDTRFLPEQEKSFDWRTFSADRDTAWDSLVRRFDSNQENLIKLLDQHDDSLLDQMVDGKPYTFHYLLTGLVQHDLYHLGQIVYINKLLDDDDRNPPWKGLLPSYNFRIFSFESLALNK